MPMAPAREIEDIDQVEALPDADRSPSVILQATAIILRQKWYQKAFRGKISCSATPDDL